MAETSPDRQNRAVHLYDEIDPTEVFAIMENHLDDFEVFIRAITQRYFLDRDETEADGEA